MRSPESGNSTESSSVRDYNLEQVLAALRRADPGSFVTREELSNATGLALATVARAVKALTGGDRPLVESGRSESSRRSAEAVRLLEVDGFVAGIEFSHHKITAAIGDLRANIDADAWRIEDELGFDVDTDADAAIKYGAELLKELVSQRSPDALIGIGLAVAAPVALATPTELRQVRGLGGTTASGLPSWVGLRPAQRLRELLANGWGVPIELDNDANFAALDEFRWSQRYWSGTLRDVIHVKWASGVGAGLVLDGRIYRGAAGFAGEFGHSPIPGVDAADVSTLDPCKRCGHQGCLESVISYARMREIINPHARRQEIDQSDAGQELISRYSRYLGNSLAPLVNALNPQLIIISGPTDVVRDLVIAGVRDGLTSYAAPGIRSDVQVKLAEQRWERLGEPGSRFSVVSGAMHRVLDLHGGAYLRRLVDRAASMA